jgi:hypothetical protein
VGASAAPLALSAGGLAYRLAANPARQPGVHQVESDDHADHAGGDEIVALSHSVRRVATRATELPRDLGSLTRGHITTPVAQAS